MKKFTLVLAVCVMLPSVVWAWGADGHKLINRNALIHLPSSMQQLIGQQVYLETHASDPDNIARIDFNHFIDIDSYPNFQNKILRYDSLVAIYGSTGSMGFTTIGTLPWVTVTALDSLTAQFKRGDWTTAYLTAAYLGHWVGDGHQPLHLTKNFNVDGMHSRYESNMLKNNLSSFVIVKDSVHYIANPLDYVFHYIDVITSYSDSINTANTRAKAETGSNSSAAYYASIWSQTGTYTIAFIQQSTVDLASFWYTAWMNAGLLLKLTDVVEGAATIPEKFSFMPNYPNPFNPSTTVQFTIGSPQVVTLTVYDVLGRSVAMLVNGELNTGTYAIRWNASDVPSGVYYCRLQVGTSSAVQKMILQK